MTRGKLTRRERRECRAERKREAIYKHATVSVARESADSSMGAIPPGKPTVERRLDAGDHVILHHYNRTFVVDRATRVPLVVFRGRIVACVGLFLAMFGCLMWISGDLPLQIALVGAALTAAATVFEFRRRARLEANGRLLTGEVTNVEWGYVLTSIYPPPAAVWTYQLRISYRFLTPTGEERAGGVSFKDENYAVPSPGDQLAILYADGIKERVM